MTRDRGTWSKTGRPAVPSPLGRRGAAPRQSRPSRLLALHVPFELRERWSVLRVENLPPELDRDLRRVALHAGEQGRLDALQLLRAFVDLLLDQTAERLDDGVGEQDAEEGA